MISKSWNVCRILVRTKTPTKYKDFLNLVRKFHIELSIKLIMSKMSTYINLVDITYQLI